MEDLGKAAGRLCSDAAFTLVGPSLVTEESHLLCSPPQNSVRGCLSRVTDAGHWVGVCPGVQLQRPTWVRHNPQAGLHQEWRRYFAFDFSFSLLIESPLGDARTLLAGFRILRLFLNFSRSEFPYFQIDDWLIWRLNENEHLRSGTKASVGTV